MIYGYALIDTDDFFVAAIPEDVDVNTVDAGRLRAEMDRQAQSTMLAQYTDPPMAILLQPTDWLITDSADEVEAFQPAHDCDKCRQGNANAREFLVANPGRYVACGNLHYIEVWKIDEFSGRRRHR